MITRLCQGPGHLGSAPFALSSAAKDRYDPTSFFRMNASVPPTRAARARSRPDKA
jgi:hypothetical protein